MDTTTACFENSSSVTANFSVVPDSGAPEIPQWVRIVEYIYLTMVVLLGIPGNTLIILVQLKKRSMSSTEWLMMTMAGFELLCSSLNVPLQIMRNTPSIWTRMASNRMCGIRTSLIFVTTLASTFLLAAIAIDRYIKTCRPLTRLYSVQKAKHLCVVLSVCSVVGGIPSLISSRLHEGYDCHTIASLEPIQNVWNSIVVSLIFTVFIVITVAYTRVIVTLRRRHRRRVAAKLQQQPGVMAIAKDWRKSVNKSMRTASNKVAPLSEGNRTTDGGSGDVAAMSSSLASTGLTTLQATTSSSSTANSVGQWESTKTSNKIIPTASVQPYSVYDGASPRQQRQQTNDGTSMTVALTDETVQNEVNVQNEVKQPSPSPDQSRQRDGNGTPLVTTSEDGTATPQNSSQNDVKDARCQRVAHAGLAQLQTLVLEEKRLNRTTLILFIITIVFVSTWFTNVVLVMVNDSVLGAIVAYLSDTIFYINAITNPCLFFCMCPVFRADVKKIVSWK